MITCPKCHYKRTAADTAPDWQCPSCGIVYAKANARPREAPEESMASELTLAQAQHNPLIRPLAIGAAVLALAFMGYKWLSKPKAPLGGSAPVTSSDVLRAKANLRLEAAENSLRSSDYAKALPELNAMAAENNAGALFHLARMHSNGSGVPKDLEKSLALYQQSAALGEALAEVDLGRLYETGTGVTKAYGQAAGWYRRAARGGDGAGLSCLANLYARGWGVDPNPTMAYMLYEMVGIGMMSPAAEESRRRSYNFASYGCSPSSYSSAQMELAKKMSLVQVQRAKDLAKTWTFDQPLPE